MQKRAWDGLRVWGGSELEGNGIQAGLPVPQSQRQSQKRPPEKQTAATQLMASAKSRRDGFRVLRWQTLRTRRGYLSKNVRRCGMLPCAAERTGRNRMREARDGEARDISSFAA